MILYCTDQFTVATQYYCGRGHVDCVATQLSAISVQAVSPTTKQWTEYEATHVELLGLQFSTSSHVQQL